MYGTSGVNAGSDASVRASNIEMLLSLWTKDRRAKGGWWALAGFSFQSALYLFRFFQQLQNSAKPPAELAKTELLSDILVPKDGLFTLIQVKRTLDRPRLAAALREAYEIAKLCDADLLAKLSFKIACIECATPARPKDFAAEEVGGDSVDIELWTRLLGCFDETDAIIEEPDPLDHLYDFLWHVGIRDVAGFVDNCLGLLLRVFANPSEKEINELAWGLSHAFHTARNSSQGPTKRIGHVLDKKDVELAPHASADQGILFDRRPRLTDLQLGRVRERPAIFLDIIKKFEPWWRGVITAEEAPRVPVFWIEGRSGEGKSVLLLQLAQRILTDAHPPVLSYLGSADELPGWIQNQRAIQQDQTNLAWLPALAVVDDLHFIRDLEEWGARLRAATDLMSPRVAVLACGPTLEREKFQSGFSTFFNVVNFSVPNLDRKEMETFRDWVAERTGRQLELDTTDVANRMLVVWIFELLRGESIREFAGNFRRRLIGLGLFDLARAILAANALELPAPTKLVESMSDNQRDAFQALCSASQLHFEKVEGEVEALGGYRLSHPQIDWQLYREWASPPTTLTQQWGRDLARSLVAEAWDPSAALANNLIFRLSTSSKLSEADIENLHTGAGTIDQALSELYRKQSAELSLEEAAPVLPRWLEVTFRGLARNLDPDPVQQALRLASHELQIKALPPFVAGWLWRISELDAYRDSTNELRAAAQSIIFVAPPKAGIGPTLGVIASKSAHRQAALQLCKKWLQENPTYEDAYVAIGSLLGAWPQDEEVIVAGWRWAEGNLSHNHAYWLLAALVAARPADDRVVGVALKWVEDNPRHQQAYELIKALAAARPADDKVVGIGLKWVEDNPTHQQGYELIRALVAARPADDKVVGVARTWLDKNPNHAQAYNLLTVLITRSNGADEWMRKGKEALLNAIGGAKRSLLVALLAGSKANQHYVELTLDAVQVEADARNKAFLLSSLGRSLANNVQSALLFLASQATPEHRRLAAQALARALRTYPNRAVEFLDLSRTSPAEYTGLLLSACISSEVSGDALNTNLRRWLNDHQYVKGYGAVLKALKQHPDRWQALKEFGGLSVAVQIDYARL